MTFLNIFFLLFALNLDMVNRNLTWHHFQNDAEYHYRELLYAQISIISRLQLNEIHFIQFVSFVPLYC